jgi:glutaredoxin
VSAPGAGTLVITLYGRPGCHLCDEARAAIVAMRPELPPVELREVDIDEDDDLLRAYLERIPVVEVSGEVVSELRFDPARLRAKLDIPVGTDRRGSDCDG